MTLWMGPVYKSRVGEFVNLPVTKDWPPDYGGTWWKPAKTPILVPGARLETAKQTRLLTSSPCWPAGQFDMARVPLIKSFWTSTITKADTGRTILGKIIMFKTCQNTRLVFHLFDPVVPAVPKFFFAHTSILDKIPIGHRKIKINCHLPLVDWKC